MIDLNGVLGALQGEQGRRTAMIGGGAGLAGLATGLLAGKSGRKMVGKAAKYGAVAALGGLAYYAISRNRNRQPSSNSDTPPPAQDYGAAPEGTAYLPAASDASGLEARGRSLVRAMIAAAKADGAVSAAELAAIRARMQQLQLDEETRGFVEHEISRPLSMDDVVAEVTYPEHAAEVYAASLVAIDTKGAVEQAYLQLLAARLRLDPSLTADIRAAAEADVDEHPTLAKIAAG